MTLTECRDDPLEANFHFIACFDDPQRNLGRGHSPLHSKRHGSSEVFGVAFNFKFVSR
jgi:hypothetical protein